MISCVQLNDFARISYLRSFGWLHAHHICAQNRHIHRWFVAVQQFRIDTNIFILSLLLMLQWCVTLPMVLQYQNYIPMTSINLDNNGNTRWSKYKKEIRIKKTTHANGEDRVRILHSSNKWNFQAAWNIFRKKMWIS